MQNLGGHIPDGHIPDRHFPERTYPDRSDKSTDVDFITGLLLVTYRPFYICKFSILDNKCNHQSSKKNAGIAMFLVIKIYFWYVFSYKSFFLRFLNILTKIKVCYQTWRRNHIIHISGVATPNNTEQLCTL